MAEFDYLKRRFRNIGMNRKDAHSLFLEFSKQLRHQGRYGAVLRFKHLGDVIYSFCQGQRMPHQQTWVKTKNLFPVCIYYMKKYDLKILLSVAKIARAIKLPEVLPHQVAKVVQGVISPCKGSDYQGRVSHVLQLGVRAFGLKPTLVQPSCPDLIVRQFQNNGDNEYLPRIKDAVDFVFSSELAQRLPYVSEAFLPLKLEGIPPELCSLHVGVVNAVQEGGAKLRMFASPRKVVQSLLSPIHEWINSFRLRVGTDCTYNQASGAEWAQQQMISGRNIFSVDLTTATCRFPLDIQIDLLRSLGLDQVFLDFLEYACSGTWIVNPRLIEQGFPSTLSWVVGQPLGIKPSMSMFSLAHNLLLAGLCHEIGLDPCDSFRVLGDDVVISNLSLNNSYRAILDLMGVPISENKTHSSQLFAEFAGFAITPNFMVRGGKWSRASIDNHLSISEMWETPLFNECSPDMISTQKFWLFRANKYTPINTLEYSKLLRVNSLFDRNCLEVRGIIQNQRLFLAGVRDCFYLEYPNVKIPISNIGKRDPSWDSIFNAIPDAKWAKSARSHFEYFESTTDDFHLKLHYAYSYTLMCLGNAFVDGCLDSSSLLDIVKTVEARVFEFLWVPPVKDGMTASSFHKRVMSLYLNYYDHGFIKNDTISPLSRNLQIASGMVA